MGKAADYARERQAEMRGTPTMQINPVFPRESLPVGAPVEDIKDTRTAYENYGSMSVDAILEAVQKGEMNSTEVVALENTGKKRKGILEKLGAPVATEVQVEETDPPADLPVTPPAQ